jgi:hypothetical protein
MVSTRSIPFSYVTEESLSSIKHQSLPFVSIVAASSVTVAEIAVFSLFDGSLLYHPSKSIWNHLRLLIALQN